MQLQACVLPHGLGQQGLQIVDQRTWIGGGQLAALTPATHDAFAQHVPALFIREPVFASDGSSALYFRRSQST